MSHLCMLRRVYERDQAAWVILKGMALARKQVYMALLLDRWHAVIMSEDPQDHRVQITISLGH